MCKHELRNLVGTADGIVCRGCGRTFKSFAEIEANKAPMPKPRTRKKKEVTE